MHPDGVFALWLGFEMQKTVHLVDLLFLNAHCLQLPIQQGLCHLRKFPQNDFVSINWSEWYWCSILIMKMLA